MSQTSSTLSVATRSLGHFAVGRVISAVVGICTLLLLVRALNRSDYGLYVALFAGFEILQTAASPGAYAVAFRYLPELRASGAVLALARLVASASVYRLLTLATVAIAMAAGAESIAKWLGVPQQGAVVRIYALVLAFEGMARFMDVQFESLLLQGTAQVSSLVRNGAKALALAVASVGGTSEVSLHTWLQLEAATSGLGAVVSCGLMARHLRRMSPGAAETVDTSFARLSRFALPTYFSQTVYLASGPDMAKLLVNKFIGSATTAAFGFASALSATLQRYLPSFLLVGWVRPLLIAARQQGRPADEIVALAITVLKLNLLTLVPVISLIAVAGPALLDILAGGRLPDSLPYLHFFLLLLVFQSIRGVISLLGMVVELGAASLRATLISVLGLAGGVMLFPSLGAWGLCVGLLVSEALWSLSMTASLGAKGMRVTLPWMSIAKCLVGVAGAAALAHGLLLLAPSAGTETTIAAGLLAAALSLALCAALKPFQPAERDLINRLLPRRLFVW